MPKPCRFDLAQVVIVGSKADLAAVASASGPLHGFIPSELSWAVDALRGKAVAGADSPASASTLTGPGSSLTLGCLPTAVSRHNSPALPHSITSIVRGAVSGEEVFLCP